jgi:hypothetical protein
LDSVPLGRLCVIFVPSTSASFSSLHRWLLAKYHYRLAVGFSLFCFAFEPIRYHMPWGAGVLFCQLFGLCGYIDMFQEQDTDIPLKVISILLPGTVYLRVCEKGGM